MSGIRARREHKGVAERRDDHARELRRDYGGRAMARATRSLPCDIDDDDDDQAA